MPPVPESFRADPVVELLRTEARHDLDHAHSTLCRLLDGTTDMPLDIAQRVIFARMMVREAAQLLAGPR